MLRTIISYTNFNGNKGEDYIISDGKQKVLDGIKITYGRLRHVQIQLRIENNILTKNGQPVVPGPLQKFCYAGDAPNRRHSYTPNFEVNFIGPTCTVMYKTTCTCVILAKDSNRTPKPKPPLLPIQAPEYPM